MNRTEFFWLEKSTNAFVEEDRRGGTAPVLGFALVATGTVLVACQAAAAEGGPLQYQLAFSTYFGGSGGDMVRDMTVDAEGNIYVAGVTGSADFPRPPGVVLGQPKGGGAMVAKFSPDGRLIWSKVVGGDKAPYFYTVKVDRAGFVYVAGRMSPGFPTTRAAFQPTTQHPCGFVGKGNVGIVKISPGGALLAATYLGGSGQDACNGPDQIVVDGDGHVIIACSTSSADYPVTAGAMQTRNAGAGGKFPFDGAVSIVSNDLRTLLYSSYIGGSGDEMARACCFGRAGTLYVGGVTTSRDFPTKNACQAVYGGDPGFGSAANGGQFPVGWGNGDAWLAKFSLVTTGAPRRAE